jgi:hypothetical protein
MESLAVFWLTPPYYDPNRAVPAHPSTNVRRHRLGEVLALLGSGAAPTPREVESALKPFWGTVWVARVLVVPAGMRLPRSVKMGALGLDAVLEEDEVGASSLRLALTDSDDFESGVVQRLSL